ncbi:Cu(I)-responsive transcriptional regulator [Asticcacaulis sp. AND118]|uniref:Cu(I)-responsive transcriptional regulator n=1 Tax=Asticcacaulis sp. AND118 TaxID=2840468 RepID=UPI001CFFC1D5|nr:Cu(I)-responsive transcriptional regulator [Asticcacaulis sp. AND118]UDF04068.1 Cu(I)-responsive transcriptional regulator [Asticcacaulis sp. AND118]
MNIGQVAKASGVSAKMIRYYERNGLISPAERLQSGYRDYSNRDVQVLQFIRRARDLGFSVAEISTLLGLWSDEHRQSADVKRLAQTHISDLHQRIQNLEQMARTLQELVGCCAGDDQPNCPIIANLEKPLVGAEVEGQPDSLTRLRDLSPATRRS